MRNDNYDVYACPYEEPAGESGSMLKAISFYTWASAGRTLSSLFVLIPISDSSLEAARSMHNS